MDTLPAITDCRRVRARDGCHWFTSGANGLDLMLWTRQGVPDTLELSGSEGGREWALRWSRRSGRWHLTGVDHAVPSGPHHAASALLRGASPVSPARALAFLRAMSGGISPTLASQLAIPLPGDIG